MPDAAFQPNPVEPSGIVAPAVTSADLTAVQTADQAYTDSAVAPFAGVAGMEVSPQYSFDVNAAAGNLTTVAASIAAIPELSWPEWSVSWYFYSTNGSICTVGGWSTDGTGTLFFKIVSLSSGLQSLLGTVFVYIVGRP